jgi:hypothetical protein
VAGSCGSPSYSRIPQVQTFRFATINLFTRFVDPGHLARVLDEVEPDLLVAVEMAPKAADVIAPRFEHHHLRPDRGFDGWGVAGRFPLDVSDEKSPWGRGGAVRVDIGDATLHLAVVHIYDPLHRPLRETTSRRRREVDGLLAWGETLPSDEPQLVAGDFNATPIWPVYRRLTRRWPDLLTAPNLGRPHRTWGLPIGPRLLRIDHLLGTGIEAAGSSVVKVRGSDHHMLVADLRVL